MARVEEFGAADLLICSDAIVGEGPVIDARTSRLVWVDIDRGLVFENDLDTADQRMALYPTKVGAVAPRAAGDGFAAAVSDGFAILDEAELTMVDPAVTSPALRMNDAKVDSRGRMWAGSMHTEYKAGRGSLHRWDGKSPSAVMATGLTLPNGIGWNSDDSMMYLIDSFAHAVMRADFDVDDGRVGAFSTLARIEEGLPDGLAVDTDDCIWVAVWGSGEIRRLSPQGEHIGRIDVPVTQPASCAFTPDGTLVITSARAGLTDQELAEQPLAGSVFAIDVGVSGLPIGPFAG